MENSVDAYLAQQMAPPQDGELVVDSQYFSCQLVTPIGRVAGVTLTAPRAVAQNKEPNFYLRLLLNPLSCDGRVPDLMQAIGKVVMARFPSEQRGDPATGQMRTFTGWDLLFIDEKQGGLWYPLQDGDQMYAKDPAKNGAYRRQKFINASITAKNKQGGSNQPPCFDANGGPIGPDQIYLGCYARAVVNVFAYPKPGSNDPGRGRGVAITLKSVQFCRHGERMSSYDAVSAGRNAFAKAGTVPNDPTAPAAPSGSAPPGFAAPGGAPPGFAAPPAGFAAPSNGALPAQYQPEIGKSQPQPWTPAA